MHVEKIDANTGQILTGVNAGSATSGVYGADAIADTQNILQSGSDDLHFPATDYLRSVNATSGATDWQTSYPAASANSPMWGPYLAFSSADGIAAMSYTTYAVGGISVAMFNRFDGSQRWTFAEFDYVDQERNVWASGPQTDGNGDVYVSYTAELFCYPTTQICPKTSLVKFSKIDGHVVWRNDMVGTSGYFGQAAQFSLIGNDVIVAGPFSGSLAGNNAVRLSGVDGSVMWTNNVFGGAQQSGLFLNNDGSVTLTNGQSRAVVDSATGILRWQDSVPFHNCLAPCNLYGVVQLSDGTIISVGNDGLYPLFYRHALIQNTAPIYSYFGVENPTTQTVLTSLFADENETLWVRGRTFAGGIGVWYLSKLDPAVPKLYDAQILGTFSNDPFADYMSPGPFGAPRSDQLLAGTESRQVGQPWTQGAALYDTSLDAHGDLSINATSADSNAGVSTFHIVANYTGDASITSAKIIFSRATPSAATSMSCSTASASNCVIDNSAPDVVEVTFDIQPGGSVTVSGQFDDVGSHAARLYAMVFGPTSLGEPDIYNNFVRIIVPDEIFHDGFQ